MLDFLNQIGVFLGSERYSQHAICLTSDPIMMILYVASDLGTFFAYATIGTVLLTKRIHIVRLSPAALSLYGSFILLCAANHLTKIFTLFWGIYRLDIVIQALMATVSLATAALTVMAVYGASNDAEARA